MMRRPPLLGVALVLNWFRRRETRTDSPHRIDPKSAAGVYLKAEADLLKPIGLHRRALDWLLDGTDDAVLAAIEIDPAAADKIGSKLARTTAGFPNRDLREDLANQRQLGIPTLNDQPEACHRLGRFLCAATPKQAFQPFIDLPAVPRWLHALLWEASDEWPDVSSRSSCVLDAPTLAAAIAHAGEDPALLVEMALHVPPGVFARVRSSIRRLRGIDVVLTTMPDHVARCLATDDAAVLEPRLSRLQELGVDPTPWIERIAILACGSRKTVSRAAMPLLQASWAAAEPPVRRIAVDGATADRLRAIELLVKHGGEEAHAFLAARAGADPSAKVRESVTASLAEAAQLESSSDEELKAPPAAPLPPPTPLTPAQRLAVEAIADVWLELRRGEPTHGQNQKEPPSIDLPALIASLGSPKPWPTPPSAALTISPWRSAPLHAAIVTHCGGADWTLPQLVRLAHHLAWFAESHPAGHALPLLTKIRTATGAPWDARQLDEAATWCGIPAGELVGVLLAHRPALDALLRWGEDAIWPLLLDHVETLTRTIDPDTRSPDSAWHRQTLTEHAFRLVETFPRMPGVIARELWKFALGTQKAWRARAQHALRNAEDLAPRLIRALGDGQQETRAVAARWIGDQRIEAAADAVAAAAASEKADAAKAAMLRALEQLGRNIDHHLDRASLRADAEKALKKVPKPLQWLVDLELPPVRWRDGDTAADALIVRGWLLKSAKLKDPVPDPMLRRHTGLLRPDDAHALGRHLLVAWITEDTRRPTEVTAAQLQTWRAQAQSWLRYYPGRSIDELVEGWRRDFLSKPLGSAIAAKGMLAVAAACGGAELGPLAATYLRTWHGHRVHQCKALLAMLAWTDEPSATQTLLATSVRFRTAGIRKEAARLAQDLAERNGWTMDELADRTLPTAGFDDAGRQELCYRRPAPEGADPESEDFVSRRIELRLEDDLSIAIVRDDGKVAKSLPAGRQGEDDDSIKAAKKALSASRKAIKEIVQQQTSRLREAMCTERAWPADEWRRFLLDHPVVGRLCRRVVWLARGDGRTFAFRPLEDGTLTSVDDDEVDLPAEGTVQVAHGTLLGDAAEAWRRHLEDFEITPLFEQFPVLLAELPEGWEQLERLESRRGWMTTAFKLRGRAGKLGYVRGAAADAGWFTSYHRAFPSIGLEAVIEFTGNPLPEQERDVAILALYFTKAVEQQSFGAPPPDTQLGEVPAVLLDECRADLAAVAGDGPGFDPDWEKKSEY